MCWQGAKLGASISRKGTGSGSHGRNSEVRGDFEEERQKCCSYFSGGWKTSLLKNRREAAPNLGAAYSHYSLTVSFLIVSVAPVPWLHVPRGQKKHHQSCQSRKGGDTDPMEIWKWAGYQPHTPGKYLCTEEEQTGQKRPVCFSPLRLLSKQRVAFFSDFNLQIALKHCRKQHGNLFLMMVTKVRLSV